MSRHRDFRNLNIDDELDDDALSDGGELDMTPEQQAQLLDGLEQVRLVIGGEDVSGLPDATIKDILWEYYFDIEKTIQWAIEEQERRYLAKERKGVGYEKGLPSTPRSEGSEEYSESYQEQDEYIARSRVPLIVLARQGQQGYDEESSDPEPPRDVRLSTITERTERTEPSPHWPSRRQLVSLNTPRPVSSSPQTSYGQLLDYDNYTERSSTPLDPNLIPVSPSGSALHRMSIYERAPSTLSSQSRSPHYSPPKPPSEPVPSIEGIPDIPDYNSKSSKQALPSIQEAPKKSKLSMLANARASSNSTRSESSGSSGTALTGSVRTYSALRPSAQSIAPPSSVVQSVAAPTPKASSTSSHVRRAIQTALDQEAVDRGTTPAPSQPQSYSSASSDRSKTPTPDRSSASTFPKTLATPSSSEKQVPTRQLSKLALMAQAKAEANKSARTLKPDALKLPVPPHPPTLPEEHTEYLSPIANGPTVTTAITTSYQSLYSLTDPSRRAVLPAHFVVPLDHTPPSSKQSKLAMKIKKANEKHTLVPVPADEVISPPISPIFSAKPTRAHKERDAEAEARHRARKDKRYREKLEQASSFTDPDVVAQDIQDERRHHHRKHKQPKPVVPDFSPPLGFTFDGPSPDDIIFNARRGTALAQQKNLPSTSTPRSAVAAKNSSKS